MNSFYSENELNNLGFASVGLNVFISRKSSIYNANKINIGNNVRIDDFCILSGNITIGDYIHIAAYSALYGGASGITLEDFANISSKVTIYSVSDDYSGETMTNPMIPEKYKNVVDKAVLIKKHTIIGSGCVVLPGVILGEGSSFGALTLINKSTDGWGIYAGIPFRKIKDRKKDLLKLEKQLLESMEI